MYPAIVGLMNIHKIYRINIVVDDNTNSGERLFVFNDLLFYLSFSDII